MASMRLSGRPRRMLRAAHVVVAGAWLGLVVAMLVLGITVRTSSQPMTNAAVLDLMGRIGGTVIPPLAVASLLSGFALALLTTWGIARHWWVIAKIVLGLAVIVTAIALTDAWIDHALARPATTGTVAGRLIAASVAHLVMLGSATVVSVDKPWGRTPYGRRRAPNRGR